MESGGLNQSLDFRVRVQRRSRVGLLEEWVLGPVRRGEEDDSLGGTRKSVAISCEVTWRPTVLVAPITRIRFIPDQLKRHDREMIIARPDAGEISAFIRGR